MRLIKKGCDNPNFGKEVTCKGNGLGKGVGGCGAILHIVPSDVFYRYLGDGDYNAWYECPECRAKTPVRDDLFGVRSRS